MTAKQTLRDFIDRLSEEEAVAFLDQIRLAELIEFEPMTAEQRASVERGMAQTDAGLSVPHEEVMRRFGRA